MNDNQHLNIPLFLRGLSFDGEKGAVVVTVTGGSRVAEIQAVFGNRDQGETGIAVLDLPDKENDGEAVLKELKELLKEDTLPSVIILKDRAVFALADDYDEARSRLDNIKTSGHAEPYVIRRSSGGYDRSAVVRGKVCVVTGGAQGFGAEIAGELTEAGAYVVLADLNREGAKEYAEKLNSRTGKTAAFPVEVNVADEDSVVSMIDETIRTLGGIDVFISNAGVLKAGSVKELSRKDFSFVTDVNYTGYFLCVKHASRAMALQNRAGGGTYYTDIIQINSKSGLQGSNRNGAYAGGKFGGIGLTQSFALELVKDNIKVNAICPGNFFEGPLWSDPDRGLFVLYLNAGKIPGAKSVEDVKRFYEEKVPMNRGCRGRDVVKAVYYCIEQKYETGQAVPVTGGQVMLS